MRIIIAILVAIVAFILSLWGLSYTGAPAQGFLAFVVAVIAGLVTYYSADRFNRV